MLNIWCVGNEMKRTKKKKKRMCVTLGNWDVIAWYQSLGIRIPRVTGPFLDLI